LIIGEGNSISFVKSVSQELKWRSIKKLLLVVVCWLQVIGSEELLNKYIIVLIRVSSEEKNIKYMEV
jgi:hypothetical protein